MPSQNFKSKESEDRIVTSTINTTKIGWNVNHQPEGPEAKDVEQNDRSLTQPDLSSLAKIQMSHKHMTDRFEELLNLFENFTKIVRQEHTGGETLALKRTKSEQLVHKEASELSDISKSSASLMQLSESTLVGYRKPVTSEMSCQTSWTLLKPKQIKLQPKAAEAKGKDTSNETKPSKIQQHTIHIEVESVTSTTALQRAPLRQRFWHIVVQVGNTLKACVYMIGENFTYILFILLCIWCLYLVIGHYYSFLQDNVTRQTNRLVIVNPDVRQRNQLT
ncbi:uncharacterized protein [Drosophila tropicalis]|uniref:uncharacterized protein n=1 Tax=Drosophila tropicalis TaxID=46794 RepID=UPI0035AC1C98